MDISFHRNAWEDYNYFLEHDKKIIAKINKIIKDITRNPFHGIGKPEALKHTLSGLWSRRINHEHRLVYTVKNSTVYILQCRYRY